jgi:hypothetical protein
MDAKGVVRMGCGGECPYTAGIRQIDWELPDRSGSSQPIEVVGETREEIERRFGDLTSDLDRVASPGLDSVPPMRPH